MGLVAPALSQRSLLALAIGATFADLGWQDAVFALLLFFVGLRFILYHQLQDAWADEVGGVRTFVRARGTKQAYRLIPRLLLPLEVTCLVVSLAGMVRELPRLGLPLLLLVPWIGLWVWRRRADPAFRKETYDVRPLDDFYSVYWPLSLSVLLALQHPLLAILPAGHLLWHRRKLAWTATRLFGLPRAMPR